MKRLYILLLLCLNLLMFSQKQYYWDDSLIQVPKQPKKHINLTVFSDYKMFASISAVTSVGIPALILSNDDDKFGKYAFSTISTISITSGIISLSGYMKSKDSKRPFLHYSCMFFAGTMDGFNEELTHHYSRVKYKMPYLNDQWFNPSISWSNKYKNNIVSNGQAYPGSTGLLVGFTDAYHATRLTNKILVVGGMITFDNKKSFKKNLKHIGLSCFSYTMGKGIVHFLIQS